MFKLIYFKKTLLFIFVFSLLATLFQDSVAQTGPAGIGTSDGAGGTPVNVIWLEADALGLSDGSDITTWSDISGNSNDFSIISTYSPIYRDASPVNGHAYAEFSKSNNRIVLNPFSGMPSDKITTIIVYKTSDSGDGLVSYATTAFDNTFLLFNNSSLRTFINDNTDYNSGVAYNGNSWQILTHTWRSSDGALRYYKDGSQVAATTFKTGEIFQSGGSLALGGEQDGVNSGYQPGQAFQGNIAEVIMYGAYLTTVQKNIVENHLSAKYNISISNDLYAGDGIRNYDAGVVGIGLESDGSHLSNNSAGLYITPYNGTLDQNGEYIFWGHDNKTNGVSTDSLGTGVQERWIRSWYVDKTTAGTLGGTLAFDFGDALGGGYPANTTDYVLLRLDLGGTNNYEIVTVDATRAAGDRIYFDVADANLADGFYTLGSTDATNGPVDGVSSNTNWYSYKTGNWNDPRTWTQDPSGTTYIPSGGGVPRNMDNVEILTGDAVTANINNIGGNDLVVHGELAIGTTSGHAFQTISGDGLIKISGSGGTDNFPDGDSSGFGDAVNGGTLVIDGSGLTLDNAREFNNVEINLDASANTAVLTADWTINGNLDVQQGVLQINDATAGRNLDITVDGNVNVQANGKITTGTGNSRHEFNFYGDLTNSGTIAFTNRVSADYNNEATDGIVDANFYAGDKDQTIDCQGPCTFYRIEIDKGTDQTYILDIKAGSTTDFKLFGAANYAHAYTAQLTANDNAIGLLKGTVRFNDNIIIPVLTNNGNYNVSEAARLWVNGGEVSLASSASSLVPYGIVQVSSGSLTSPVTHGIILRDNGSIVVEGGTVTTNQIRTSVLGATNIGSYTQTGGTVNVTGGSINRDYYTFSLTYSGNTFTMSGGTLKISGSQALKNNTGSSGQIHGGALFIKSAEGNYNVTGGTVIIDNNTSVNAKITSNAPLWNLTLVNSGGAATEFELDGGTSGAPSGSTYSTITDPRLRVLNNFVIEDNTFDHNGYDVEIGSDFIIQAGADYLYDNTKKNTTIINGYDNSKMAFYNRTGGSSDRQHFFNLVINKSSGKTVTLLSGKTGTNLNGNRNNLLQIDGEYFKVLSGTLDQGNHSIRVYSDTLVNYDVLTVYDSANAATDSNPNSDNDLLKFRDPFVLITADTSQFGNISLSNGNNIVTMISDIYVERLEYRHGRINLRNNNLKIDNLSVDLDASSANWNGCGGCFSVEDMLITDGKSSNGGLSLYINANATYTFPIGVGTDGVDADVNTGSGTGNSKYTPATVTVTNFSDDGYITIRPADKVLATTVPNSGDILSYYWRVDYEGFTTLPTVSYQFTYYDVDLDGSSNVANFVPGKVLEVDPYTRSSETASNFTTSSSGPPHVFGTITFNGDTGGGSSPFTLEEASYTAGEQPRFVGAPKKYYTSALNKNWNDGSIWHENTKTGPTGTVPPLGSIAIIYWENSSSGRGRVKGTGLTAANEPSKIIFEHDYVTNPIPDNETVPRLQFYNPGTYPLGEVSGTGMISFDAPDAITVTGDFGEFAKDPYSYYLYFGGSATINNIPEPIPNLLFEGTSPKIIDQNIEINASLIVQGNVLVRPLQNIVINKDLVLGYWKGGTFEFPASGSNVTIDVKGNIDFTQNSSSNPQDRNITVQNSNSTLEHTLKVGGDIIHGSDNGWNFDLYSASNRPKVILELTGSSNGRYYRTSNSVPNLYRIVMNKGTDKIPKFTFDDDFLLFGPTSGAGVPKAVEIQNGTLVLNDVDIDIDLTTGDDNFVIPETGGLHVTQGTVNVSGDDSGIRLDGCLIIDGGTVNMDDPAGNGNNFIEYGAGGSALLKISSGALTVGSQIRPILTAESGILQYKQTGGTVVIGKNSGGENDRGMLQIYNAGSEFTYTAGSLTIVRHQPTPTVAALYLDPDVFDINGSTITLFNGDTPAGQSDFRINSTIPLNNLIINDTNSPAVKLDINPLTINGTLTVNTNASLDGNGLDLTLKGDWGNDGTYTASGNTTWFTSDAAQSLSGTGSFDFYNFTKNGTGTLSLSVPVDITGIFKISDGTVADGGNSITTRGNVIIDGTHTSSGGSGIVFAGSAKQWLSRSSSGTSSLGTVTINNANGVEIPDGNGYDFDISGDLRLQSGVFNIGGSLVSVSSTGDIVAVSPFGISNMVQTNSSFTDNGLRKYFPANHNTDFIFPVGQLTYTPVKFDFSTGSNTFGTSAGSITIRPSNEYHPTIDDGTDFFATGDVNNVLQYYWIINANTINGFTSTAEFSYVQADVKTDEPGYDESDYLPARILSDNNPTGNINKFGVADVDTTNNIINFSWTAVTDEGISGDYFAGINEAIPDNIATYTSITDGDVDQAIYDIPVPGGGAPRGAIVIVATGTTVNFNIDDVNLYKTEIQSGGVLQIDETDGHRLGIVTGSGTLRLISNSNSVVLPAGYYADFFSCTGGKLEYAGTGSYNILGGITKLRNLTLSGSGSRNMSNNDLIVCEDFTNGGPDFDNVFNRNITIQHDLVLNSGTFNPGTGTLAINNDMRIAGGTFSGSTGGSKFIDNDINISSGAFDAGSNTMTYIRGHLIRSGGTFSAGSGNARIIFDGSALQSIVGDFTGPAALHNVEVNGSVGVRILNGAELDNELILTDGNVGVPNGVVFKLLQNATVSPVNGRSNSFVNGRLHKVMAAGTTFTFPIGKGWRWGYATVKNTSAGTYTWAAEYYNTGPINDADVTSTTPTDPQISSISGNEYWRITDGSSTPSGVTSIIGLSWDGNSDVSANSSEREELEVMVWNGATSTWDNYGGQNFSSGHTQTAGSFESVNAVSFSEKIITLGSKDASNPLPIELVYFTGQEKDGKVLLKWETATELNNDYFVIEHSVDGKVFREIGQVPGAGNSSVPLQYSFTHSRPSFPNNYYRLKQVDFDGAFEYFDVILVRLQNDFTPEGIDFVMYPNPTSGNAVNIRLHSIDFAKPLVVEVANLNGKLIYHKRYDSIDLNTDLELDLGIKAHRGMYLVRLVQDNTTTVKKLILK